MLVFFFPPRLLRRGTALLTHPVTSRFQFPKALQPLIIEWGRFKVLLFLVPKNTMMLSIKLRSKYAITATGISFHMPVFCHVGGHLFSDFPLSQRCEYPPKSWWSELGADGKRKIGSRYGQTFLIWVLLMKSGSQQQCLHSLHLENISSLSLEQPCLPNWKTKNGGICSPFFSVLFQLPKVHFCHCWIVNASNWSFCLMVLIF